MENSAPTKFFQSIFILLPKLLPQVATHSSALILHWYNYVIPAWLIAPQNFYRWEYLPEHLVNWHHCLDIWQLVLSSKHCHYLLIVLILRHFYHLCHYKDFSYIAMHWSVWFIPQILYLYKTGKAKNGFLVKLIWCPL